MPAFGEDYGGDGDELQRIHSDAELQYLLQ